LFVAFLFDLLRTLRWFAGDHSHGSSHIRRMKETEKRERAGVGERKLPLLGRELDSRRVNVGRACYGDSCLVARVRWYWSVEFIKDKVRPIEKWRKELGRWREGDCMTRLETENDVVPGLDR